MDEESRRKRILILISEGGGGHKTAGEALKESLGRRYEIEILNAFTKIAHKVDVIRLVTRGMLSAEGLYNFLLKKGWHRAAGLFTRLGDLYMQRNRHRVRTCFERFLLSRGAQRPDLIISTIPYVNYGIAWGARLAKIPFLMMPTDLDTATFLRGLSSVILEQAFLCALPYEDPELHCKAVQYNVMRDRQLQVTGFPVRAAFQKRYSDEEKRSLKQKFGIEDTKRVVTLMGGAEGGEALFHHAMELCKLTLPGQGAIHINVCSGRNGEVRERIRSWILKRGGRELAQHLVSAEGPSLSLFGFIPEVAELMAISDLILTKTGSASVNEAIYLGRKLLLDHTKGSSARFLEWERYNVPFVKKHHLGDAFDRLEELVPLARKLLQDPAPSPATTGQFSLPDFGENILKAVDQLLS